MKRIVSAVVIALCGAAGGVAQRTPEPAFRRAAPVTMSELKTLKTAGVSVVEVSDYVYGNYQGEFKSPPHADLNPRKAFVIYWRDRPERFVFSHKATGGWGWRSLSWDHWPVGWLNSQAHDVDDESYKRYPSHFAPFGLDLWSMKNEETERRDFYSLMGVAGSDVESVRRLARDWLSRGATDPAHAASLRLAHKK